MMTEIRPLTALIRTDLQRVAGGYTSSHKYAVTYAETEDQTTFSLRLVRLAKPYVKQFEYDDGTIQAYQEVFNEGYSFGAFDGELLVGLIIGEPHHWNRSLWIPEFHVAESYRNQGIGAQLMACIAQKARQAGFRMIECETQNTNVNAIRVYRKLGFHLEGIDVSYYSNQDYPDGEIAVFMKRRLMG